jgi:hypothetical protein
MHVQNGQYAVDARVRFSNTNAHRLLGEAHGYLHRVFGYGPETFCVDRQKHLVPERETGLQVYSV